MNVFDFITREECEAIVNSVATQGDFELGATHNNISACCRNERKTCVGRKFAYYNDYCSYGERSVENANSHT